MIEELLSRRVAHESSAIEIRREIERLHDSNDGEPLVPEPHDGATGTIGNSEPFRRNGAEHDDGKFTGCLVEEDSGIHLALQRGEKIRVHGLDRDAAGLSFRYEIGAVDARLRFADRCDLLHRADA